MAEQAEPSDSDSENLDNEPKPETEEPMDTNEEHKDSEQTHDISDEAAEAESANEVVDTPKDEEPKKPNIFKRFLAKYKAKKKIAIPLTIVAFIGLILAVPFSRYAVLGLAIKKDFSVVITDSKTNIPVSGAEVSLGGKFAKTDGEGRATLSQVKVGPATLTSTKNFYKDQQTPVTVALGSQPSSFEVKMEATGRQVPVHVANKITGSNLVGAVIKALGTEAQTDANGDATIVLPPDQATVKGEISLESYNTLSVDITVQEQAIKENSFGLTPTGKIYFLSKRTGNIDVMKSDLDGSNAEVVLKATGDEIESDTLLVATRDWKYLALKSRREGEKARFYLIDTSNDKLTEIDGGDEQDTTFVGWSGHNFIYQIERTTIERWKPKRDALKTYNADSGVITIIDENKALGSSDEDYANELFGTIHILTDRVVYAKYWQASYYGQYNLSNQRSGIYSVFDNGSNKQTLKDFAVKNSQPYINSVQSEPNEVYFSIYDYTNTENTYTFYTYEDGVVEDDKDMTEEKFNKPYPAYVLSPSGDRTFWFEERDGKNTLFLGDRGGQEGEEIEAASEYKPYGWFSEDYILVSKENSELYIRPSGVMDAKGQVLKITNYHRPAYFLTYGGGY